MMTDTPNKDTPDTDTTNAGAPNAGDAAPRDDRETDPKLLEILVCPVTRGPLEYDRDAQELISRSARLAYPIRDGVPIMLPEEARTLEDDAP